MEVDKIFVGDAWQLAKTLPPLAFPPTSVGHFEMEVTREYQGQIEATFSLDDIEDLSLPLVLK